MSSTSVKAIKRRIRSARNIKQITKAMEMVAASKMRRAQESALTTRPYSIKIKEVLAQLAGQVGTQRHPMLKKPDETQGNIAIILVSSDRGLCGALNTNLFRELEEFTSDLSRNRQREILDIEFIVVGRKAREFVLKTGKSLHAEFTHFPEKPKFEDILPVTRLAIDGFLSGKFKEIYLVFTAFITTLKQEVSIARLLPVETKKIISTTAEGVRRPYKEYIFEPNASKVLDALLPQYIEIQAYQTVLEALASEHSARMVAMRNASDNATEIIAYLTLIFNKQRQQSITNEIADLTTSRMAVTS